MWLTPFTSGNHESTGQWKFGDIIGSSRDIQHVVDYLRNIFGYTVQLIVSHSLGSLASFHWLCNTSAGQQLPAFVNVSGRYRMRVSRLTIIGSHSFPTLPPPIESLRYSQLSTILAGLLMVPKSQIQPWCGKRVLMNRVITMQPSLWPGNQCLFEYLQMTSGALPNGIHHLYGAIFLRPPTSLAYTD